MTDYSVLTFIIISGGALACYYEHHIRKLE